MRFHQLVICLAISLPQAAEGPADASTGLVGHWPLAGDARDRSGAGRHAIDRGADFAARGRDGHAGNAAGFNGRDALLQVPAAVAPRWGEGDFTVSAWIDVDGNSDDLSGDILSQYDPTRRRGFHLTVKTNAGVTFNQANLRQLQFGIDDNRESEWTDCGRPGNALLVFALAAHDGHLYAGTCEPGKDESGHVYRYSGHDEWGDCGSPDQSNSVTSMAVHQGHLYAGTGKYRLAGSALPESENTTPGGRVFRFEGDGRWVDCGQLPGAEAVAGLVGIGRRSWCGRTHPVSLAIRTRCRRLCAPAMK